MGRVVKSIRKAGGDCCYSSYYNALFFAIYAIFIIKSNINPTIINVMGNSFKIGMGMKHFLNVAHLESLILNVLKNILMGEKRISCISMLESVAYKGN